MKDVSLIIPAYNEENRIAAVLDEFLPFLKRRFKSFELVVVCNGCTDSTPEIVRKYRKRGVRLISFRDALGKGWAIKEGFEVADGKIVGFFDSDSSVSSAQLGVLISEIVEGRADGVISSRYCKGARITARQPPWRFIAGRLFNLLVRLLFGLGFADTQCGAKLFKKRAVDSVKRELKTKGYAFDVELIWRMKQKGFKIVEVPIVWAHCREGKFSLMSAPKMLYDIALLKFGTLKPPNKKPA